MTWPLASVVIAVVVVIGGVALFDKNIVAVSNTLLILLMALGLAELREIKSNTNGNQSTLMEQNKKLMDELGEYRRSASRFTDRAMDAAPMNPVVVPVVLPPTESSTESSDSTTTTHSTTTVQIPVTRP